MKVTFGQSSHNVRFDFEWQWKVKFKVIVIWAHTGMSQTGFVSLLVYHAVKHQQEDMGDPTHM